MIEEIYSTFYSIFFTILCNLLAGIFAERRKRSMTENCILQFSFFASTHLASLLLDDHVMLRIAMMLLLIALFVHILYQTRVWGAVLLALLFTSSSAIIEALAIVILQSGFHVKAAQILASPSGSTLIGIFCQLLFFCIILVMKKTFTSKQGAHLTEAEWVRFSMFPCFSLISMIALLMNFKGVQESEQSVVLICIVAGIFLMNILLFGLLNDAIKREAKLAEYHLIQERSKNETEMYHSISESYNRQRKIAHEFKNHMACIMALAEREEFGELKNYLAEMHANMEKEPDQIDTGHTLINAILNAKYQEAKIKEILFVIKANDLSGIGLEDQDIVILLSNLLNNAFEACVKCEKRVVKLKFVQEERQIILSVINNYAYEPVQQGGVYLTSKTEEPEMHGIGIENIKDTVEKYNGTYAIKCEEGQFKFSILLPKKD